MNDQALIRQRALEVFPFLKSADETFLVPFFEEGTHHVLPAGQFICMEGNQCAHLPLVLTGTARVYKMAESGREITLYRIEPGESCILTASCLLSRLAFPAFAVTETEVEAFVVPAGVLSTWLHEHDAWRSYLFDLLAHRLSTTIELVEEVAFRHMDARLAAYLVQATTATRPRLERTHEGVAADLGTSREVVSRLLKDFEQKGFVALARGAIHVQEQEQLHRLAEKA